MNVGELVWWWQTGWLAWARDHGIDVDKELVTTGVNPDKAAFRARFGQGKKIGA